MSTHPMLDLSAWQDATPNPSVIVADGADVRVTVRQGCLVIQDGPKSNPRERIIAKVPRVVRHVIVLSTHGYISLDAISWMHHCDITWDVVDRTGKAPHHIAASAQNVKPTLVRQQAYCAPDGPMADIGLRIWQRFISEKLAGQAWNAENLLGDPVVRVMDGSRTYEGPASKFITDQISGVELADSVEGVMGLEGKGAAAYWAAWEGLPIQWKKPAPIKPHWLRFDSRRTLRRRYADNRGATDPVNAMLNFGYKMAEAACVSACYSAWLSPSMGVGHVDRDRRDSFALDLLETLRPRVDQIVLGIVGMPLDQRLFAESSEGVVALREKDGKGVRLRSPLTHRVASEVQEVAYKLQPHMHFVTKLLSS